MKKHLSASDAIAGLRARQRVFVHGCAATPTVLLQALYESAGNFPDVELIHLHTEGRLDYLSHGESPFRVTNLFVGANIRQSLDYSRVDYLPCFLSEIPKLLRSGTKPIDVALLHVSPPDKHGFCTLGTSVDIAIAAAQVADVVIAQINPRMPRTHGDGVIAVTAIDHALEVDVELPEQPRRVLSQAEEKIGHYIAELVEDGSTLQLGIGAIPDAAAKALSHHRHLGIHTEMWSDGTLDLIRSGAVDNSRKVVHPGKTVSSFVYGSRALYDFIDDNPSVLQLDAGYVNDIQVIARNPKVVAINSAVEVDLTGQVCADSVGYKIISGVGGQMDFIRGSSLSDGGKPIIALTSRTKLGSSRIVPALKAGAGVVTTRAHVHHIVTEFGAANLYGKTLGERAKLLIAIAHPDDREWLEKEWLENRRKTF